MKRNVGGRPRKFTTSLESLLKANEDEIKKQLPTSVPIEKNPIKIQPFNTNVDPLKVWEETPSSQFDIVNEAYFRANGDFIYNAKEGLKDLSENALCQSFGRYLDAIYKANVTKAQKEIDETRAKDLYNAAHHVNNATMKSVRRLNIRAPLKPTGCNKVGKTPDGRLIVSFTYPDEIPSATSDFALQEVRNTTAVKHSSDTLEDPSNMRRKKKRLEQEAWSQYYWDTVDGFMNAYNVSEKEAIQMANNHFYTQEQNQQQQVPIEPKEVAPPPVNTNNPYGEEIDNFWMPPDS